MTRGQYLYELASVCKVSPPGVNELTVGDFAILLAGLSGRRAELAKGR